jgi:glycogen synthase kinase 3 beta
MKPKLNILMELYDWNLKQYIKSDEAIEPLTFKALCYQMVRSLLYLHSKSICHRDVKPDNFLMKKTGRIVLSDFGSAKFMKANE